MKHGRSLSSRPRVMPPWPLALSLLLFLAACYTIPETGRVTFNLISLDQELALGASAFQEIKSQSRISDDPVLTAKVQRVGHRMSEAIGDRMPSAEWEFVLFDDDTINAFALPGGRVGINTGLFKVAESDADLALVIGHEMGHITARHGAERISQSMALGLLGAALDVAMANKDSATRSAVMAAYGLGATVGVLLPYSRRQEYEADEIGLLYMAKAGYDPRVAIPFWERMMDMSQRTGRPPAFLSTHPADEDRIANMQRLMPRMVEIYEDHPIHRGF